MTKNVYPLNPIVIVDDEEAWLHSFSLALRSAGMNNVVTSNQPHKLMEILAGMDACLLVLDLIMPQVSGDVLLQEVVTRYPDLPVIIMTGLDEVDTAVTCMKYGAYDFFTKVTEESRLLTGVRRGVEMDRLRRENFALKERFFQNDVRQPEAFAEIITHNQGMYSIFKYIEAIATTCEPVLITGETGVGKELIAHALHRLSGRSGAFVAVNIAGFDEAMLADALFGHRRGAFSGAERSREGLVARADNGTLFLDEIGELSQSDQVKLLRLIQEREYYPLGSDIAKSTNTRMIFATHRNLSALLESGAFRQDLFFRLRTHQVHIPPLRERYDDLAILLDQFMEKAAQSLNKNKPAYPRELPTLLATYPFPGNIRELQAMVFDAVSKHQSRTLSMKEFKKYINHNNTKLTKITKIPTQGSTPFTDLQSLPTLKEAGHLLVKEALRRAQGNQTIAAQMLGITRQALGWRLKQAVEKRE